jgi:hypothetical protein
MTWFLNNTLELKHMPVILLFISYLARFTKYFYICNEVRICGELMEISVDMKCTVDLCHLSIKQLSLAYSKTATNLTLR